MGRLVPAIELGTYNQGELGVYGRPPRKDIQEIDNPFKKVINEGRHVQGYWDKLETVEKLMEVMNSNLNLGITDLMSHQTGHHYDRRLEFLEDTLKFLLEGRRSIPLEQWLILIDDDSTYMTDMERRLTIERIVDMRVKISQVNKVYNQYGAMPTYISMWCEKPDGVRDMAYSLYFYSFIPQKTNT